MKTFLLLEFKFFFNLYIFNYLNKINKKYLRTFNKCVECIGMPLNLFSLVSVLLECGDELLNSKIGKYCVI